jgi:hypothetical protein
MPIMPLVINTILETLVTYMSLYILDSSNRKPLEAQYAQVLHESIHSTFEMV